MLPLLSPVEILSFGQYSVGMLVKWVAFLCTLHWPQGDVSLGVGGVSFVEVLILYELWAGERLDLEKAVLRYRGAGRSISVSVVPSGPGIDIWRSCRYIGALFRALVALPGVFVGLFLVMLVRITVGFDTLGGKGVIMASPPGLVNRLRFFFLNELLVLFGYPCGSAATLLSGVLPLRYCSGRFACGVPTWSLPAHGHVQGLIAEVAGDVVAPRNGRVGVVRAQLPGLVGVSGVRLNRKTPAHLAGNGRDGGFQSRPKVWKRLRAVEDPRFRHFGAEVLRLHMFFWTRLVLGREWRCMAHVSRFCMNRCRN